MKLVIDISKERYDEIMAMDWKNCRMIFDEEIRAIHDGKAIEQEPVMPVMFYPQVEGITPTVVEPCTDAISRQAVLDLAKFDGRENLGSIIHAFDVEQLPPVKPAEKVGQWKRVSMDKYVQHAMAYYRCSECGKDIIGTHNYCPSCGAKMEVEE